MSAPNPVLSVVFYKRERDVGVSLCAPSEAIRSCVSWVNLIANAPEAANAEVSEDLK